MLTADNYANQTVFDTRGRPYHLKREVGRGAQGVIYEEDSGDYMVKIASVINPSHRIEMGRRYRWLLNRQIPSDARLIVPLALLAPPHIGYVMERVRGHVPLTRLLVPSSEVAFGTWYNEFTGGLRRRLILGAMLARGFAALQSNGLSYCDLSDTNMLVAKDPAIQSVCLIDTDTLSVAGAAEALVLGTPGYIAPELIRRTHVPDAISDNFSLAVILFRMLRIGHPFLGDSVQDAPPESEAKALGGEYPYVDHPDDDSNQSTTVLPTEHVCTARLTGLFLKAFVDGAKDRVHRPTPQQWEEACWFAAGETVRCKHCAATFYPRPLSGNKSMCVCPWCVQEQTLPIFLVFQDQIWSDLQHDDPTLLPLDAQVTQAGAKRYVQDREKLVVDRSDTRITARYIRSDVYGKDGDRLVAIIRYASDGEDPILENRSPEDIHLWQAGMAVPQPMGSKRSARLHTKMMLYFDPPERGSDGPLRCARLVGTAEPRQG